MYRWFRDYKLKPSTINQYIHTKRTYVGALISKRDTVRARLAYLDMLLNPISVTELELTNLFQPEHYHLIDH